ncbi:hypothetical protein CO614_08540 [Lysobacteraceae bacterium NML120232]|nr:hypothetical protein CO614_08540 [Xanthomonadaceae bacterium NML120232]
MLKTHGDVADIQLTQIQKHIHYLSEAPAYPAPCDPVRKWVSLDFVLSLITATDYYDTYAIKGNKERLHELTRTKITEEMFRCAGQSDPLVVLGRQYAQCLAQNEPQSQILKACIKQAQSSYTPRPTLSELREKETKQASAKQDPAIMEEAQ